jgi:integrase
MLQKAIGEPLVEAGSPLKFAPDEGPEFFARYGWKVVEARSLLQAAAKLKRLSLGMSGNGRRSRRLRCTPHLRPRATSHSAGGELEQIQFLLGHVSVQTTERYLGCKQRIQGAVNDHLGIEP